MKINNLTIIVLFIISSKLYSNIYIDSITHDEHLLRYDSVINEYQLKIDCGNSIQNCYEKDTSSTLTLRLKNFIAWLIIRNKDKTAIHKQLDKRMLSYYPKDSCNFTKPLIKPTGDPVSPVKLIAYVKASCSLCKRVVIPLHLAVNSDILKGIATLEIRPMMDSPGNRALLAAEKQNKGWEFFLALENEERRLDEKVIMEIAKKIGLDLNLFKKALHSTEILNTLKYLRKEATSNNFNTAPTLYINNFRYQSYKDPQWLIDAIEYKYEQLKGKK